MEQLRQPLRSLKSHFRWNRRGIRRSGASAIVEKKRFCVWFVDLALTNGSMLSAAVIWAIFKPVFVLRESWSCPAYH